MASRRSYEHFVADPLSGEALSVGDAFYRMAEYRDAAWDAAREMRYAWRNLTRVRSQEKKDKWTDMYSYFYDQSKAYRDAVEKIASVLEEIPVDGGDEEPEPGEESKGSDEWEMGLMYDLAKVYNEVDINVRVRRTDGRRMSKDEAYGAIEHWITYGDPSAGYEVSGIDWKRPSWTEPTEGNPETDGPNLFGPMFAALMAGRVRLGRVKE